MSFALAAGGIGAVLGQQWIFYASAFFASETILSAWTIRNEDIDNEAARAADRDDAPEPNGRPRLALNY